MQNATGIVLNKAGTERKEGMNDNSPIAIATSSFSLALSFSPYRDLKSSARESGIATGDQLFLQNQRSSGDINTSRNFLVGFMLVRSRHKQHGALLQRIGCVPADGPFSFIDQDLNSFSVFLLLVQTLDKERKYASSACVMLA